MKKAFWVTIALCLFAVNSAFCEEATRLFPLKPDNQQPCVEYHLIKGKGYCSSSKLHPSQDLDLAEIYNTIDIQFDKPNDWRLAFWNQKQLRPMFQYTRSHETLTNWREIVTAAYYSDTQGQLTPQQLMLKLTSALQQTGFKLNITVLKSAPDEMLYEWKITGTPRFNQYTLTRILADSRGLHWVSYESRPGVTKRQRETWLRLISAATLKR